MSEDKAGARFVLWAALFGGLGVALGAFGAHGLREILSPRDLEIFETGVRYQMFHALALLGVAAWEARSPSRLVGMAGRLFCVGILIFSGSLYVLVLSGLRWMGAITPFGGLSLIAGWIALGLSAWRARGGPTGR